MSEKNNSVAMDIEGDEDATGEPPNYNKIIKNYFC